MIDDVPAAAGSAGVASEPGQWRGLADRLGRGELPPGWERVASSAFARVVRHRSGGVYYKEFLPRGAGERLKAALRGSRATRARRHSDRLRAAGFGAPENLAWGRLDGSREYLFSGAVPGQGIDRWLRTGPARRGAGALRLRRRLLHELGDFIGRLHAAGFVHGDLRAGNVLADYRDGTFRFALIDNERTRGRRLPSRRGIRRNLMQLNMLTPAEVTRGDRWCFFLAWRRHHPRLPEAAARRLARDAWHWAARRLRAAGKL